MQSYHVMRGILCISSPRFEIPIMQFDFLHFPADLRLQLPLSLQHSLPAVVTFARWLWAVHLFPVSVSVGEVVPLKIHISFVSIM